VAGGGRYDGLVSSQDGHSVPACGFAISVEPLLILLSEGEPEPRPLSVDVNPADSASESLAAATATVAALHERGYFAQLVPAGSGQAQLGVSVGVDGYALEDRGTGSSVRHETLDSVLSALPRGGRA
jgi:histidyl-tRNA synthetase